MDLLLSVQVLDCIGPFARSVEDAALIFKSSQDMIRWIQLLHWLQFLIILEDFNLNQTLRVGVPEEYFGEGLDSEVGSARSAKH